MHCINNMTKIFGSISKILNTKSNYFEFMLIDNNGVNYKIFDNCNKYSNLFIEDNINVILSKVNENTSWKIDHLCEFNRPFNTKQMYEYIGNLYKSKTTIVNNLRLNLNWTKLSELMQLQIYDKLLIIDELQKAKIDQKNINQLNRYLLIFKMDAIKLQSSNIVYYIFGDKYNDTNLYDNLFSKLLNKLTHSEIINIISDNPFSLILNDHIKPNLKNFELLDKINNSLNNNINSDIKLMALIWSTISDYIDVNQHIYIDVIELIDIIKNTMKITINLDLIKKIDKINIYQIKGINKISTIIYTKLFDQYEKYITNKINQILNSNLTNIITDQHIISKYDEHLDLIQKKCILETINNPISIITGPPGVGKTKIITVISSILNEIGINMIITAPTGLACKNISKQIPYKVYTIAKLLFVNENNICLMTELLKSHNGIIIDEASMIDMIQFYQILTFLPNNDFRIILVGDPNQLPSIGPGQILQDLINSKKICCSELNMIYRQHNGSGIINNSIKLLKNDYKLDIFDDFRIAVTGNDDETSELIVKLLEYIKKQDAVQLIDTVILTPYRKSHKLSSDLINDQVKSIFNENHNDSNDQYCIGDRVMQIKNISNKQIVNGDIGYVTNLIKHQNKIKDLVVEYPLNNIDVHEVHYNSSELHEQIKLSYAITIHKSQGNGYDNVIVVIPHNSNPIFLNKNMLYTSITRAKKKVYIIGDDISYLNKYSKISRNTRLKQRLRN